MLLVDTADKQILERTLTHPAISGFTTNPTLIARAAGVEALGLDAYVRQVDDLLDLAMRFADPDRTAAPAPLNVMVQVAGPADTWTAHIERMAARTKAWRTAGAKLFIKVPPTREGLAQCRLIRELGLGSLVTAVFNPVQAALCGEVADGSIVYLRRVQDADPGWRTHVEAIRQVTTGRGGMLLIASVSTIAHLADAIGFSQDITIAPSLIDGLLDDPRSDKALAAFDACVLAPEAQSTTA